MASSRHRHSSSIRTSVRSIRSSAETGATTKPFCGVFSTSPSEVRRASASRTAPLLTADALVMASMRSCSPGAKPPFRS